jgi:4-amino-4-deoxy-L-arabinose transferase-like glycosyltransferase
LKQVREDLLFFTLGNCPRENRISPEKKRFRLHVMKSSPLKIQEQPLLVRLLGAILLLHLVLWTLVPDLLYSVLPLDSLEAVAWGSGFSLGNAKHPPLTGWIAGLATAATGHADWPIFLLSQLCVAGGMACIYLLAREFFGREESALAALAPEFIFYYNVTSPEFNVNMPLLLLWPAAALFFVRAYRRDRISDWILLGVISGLCLICKYTSALLFAAFAVFLMLSKERRRLLLTAGPWIAAGSFCVVILPHAMWALTGGIAMMRTYVEKRMATGADASWFRLLVLNVLRILGNAFLVYLIPLGAFWLSKFERPRMPVDPVRREGALFSAVMTGVPLLVMVVIGLSGRAVRTMWLVPLFFPLGILLTALFSPDWTEKQLKRFRISVLVFFFLCLLGVAIALSAKSDRRRHFPARQFTAEVSRMYEERTGRPLEIVAGNAWLAGMFRQYAPGHPEGCIAKNQSELDRLGPMLKGRGGLAAADDCPEDMADILDWYGVPDAPVFTMDFEYRSLLGKKRKRTIDLAILEPAAAK